MLNPASASAAKRPGGITPLTCILLVVIVGMVAFAVDMSWMVLTQSELQNAADSAALAGANRLGDGYVAYNLPKQTATNKSLLVDAAIALAKASAKEYAGYNSAGGANSLKLLDGDVEVGFTNAGGAYTSYTADPSKYPNTVKVTMRRDNSANTPLGLFFAPVFGVKTMNLTATASATLYGGVVTSFKPGSQNTGLLPVTYDKNAFDNFLALGVNVDGLSGADTNGSATLKVYPSVKASGNFGLLSLDDSHAGASTIAGWVTSGASPSDVQALINNNLIPLNKHDPTKWDWNGENGFKASNVMDVNAEVGKTYLLPLFKPFNPSVDNYEAGVGNGSKYSYQIVQFVGVKIMKSPAANKEIWVQPVAASSQNAVFDGNTLAPIGTTSTVVTTLAPPRLTN